MMKWFLELKPWFSSISELLARSTRSGEILRDDVPAVVGL
jgi:hypothetical protein